MRMFFLFSLISLMGCVGCKKKNNTVIPTSITINPGNDPNFKIVANNDGILNNLPKKVVVFDIPIYAASGVEDTR